jgi:transketolase N-terminal domain/subunit
MNICLDEKGNTIVLTAAAMEHFGFYTGQTLSNAQIIEVLKFNIAECTRKIAEQEEDEVLNAEVIE